ncbi:hypothetical protein G6F31_017535 [Rhizopus arrhizus]|nr:hypothetical protein G6F31_017535 [Rhizopus arrhizus]
MQRRERRRHRPLHHHAPSAQLHARITGQHLHAHAVGHRHRPGLAALQGLHNPVVLLLGADPAMFAVIEDPAIRPHHKDIRAVAVEMLLKQLVQFRVVLQVDRGPDKPQVLPLGVLDGFGQRHGP